MTEQPISMGEESKPVPANQKEIFHYKTSQEPPLPSQEQKETLDTKELERMIVANSLYWERRVTPRPDILRDIIGEEKRAIDAFYDPTIRTIYVKGVSDKIVIIPDDHVTREQSTFGSSGGLVGILSRFRKGGETKQTVDSVHGTLLGYLQATQIHAMAMHRVRLSPEAYNQAISQSNYNVLAELCDICPHDQK